MSFANKMTYAYTCLCEPSRTGKTKKNKLDQQVNTSDDVMACLKLAAAEYHDIPMNHRHAEALFLHLRIWLGVGG